MGKIIGNFFVIYLIFCSVLLYSQPTAQLKIQSLDGKPIERIGIGQPCKLELIVTDTTDLQPTIAGLDEAAVVQLGSFSLMLHDQEIMQHHYQITYDKPGLYEIGPAVVKTKQGTVTSNRIVIEVTRTPAPERISVRVSKKGKQDKQLSATLHLSTNTTQAFVGQRITCTLALTFLKEEVSLKRLSDIAVPFKPTNVTGPEISKTVINDQEYDVALWHWDIYPEKAGDFVIPKHYADMMLLGTQVSPFWLLPQTRRIHSNDVHITVYALPSNIPSDMPIGTFTNYHAAVVPTAIKEGQATTVTLELEGDTHWDALSIQTLAGIDEALRAYPSRQQVVNYQKEGGLQRKKFEFVVHGLKVGTWDIPSQELAYFDVEMQRVETIKTDPITVTVVANADTTKLSTDANIHSLSDNALCSNDLMLQKSIAVPEIYLSWWLFWLFMCMPLLVIPLLWRDRLVKRYYACRAWYYADYDARKAVEKAEHEKDYASIYYIVTTYIASKTSKQQHEISAEFCRAFLSNSSVSAMHIEQWDQFFSDATAYAFGIHTVVHDSLFFNRAHHWLSFWRKL